MKVKNLILGAKIHFFFNLTKFFDFVAFYYIIKNNTSDTLPAPRRRAATHVCGCKGKFFWLYCQDVVPLHLEVTEKIGIIK
ncbi:hypothetical protein HMPREF1977_0048 [Capnocytophaga ochracea F0287]|uniref:Uncharacterized protein n=1 Tax=Capnocytophaga ochracea F0287 TaxID=873517 RepID=E4MNT8_CAPOC|nr:hypothetical protein HMPREF1977_0048 [Capnocytophaga ochracea F0287]EKY08415.1 hypothetical protein HMPREF9078_00828 [Capnocytophaga sp. oral taxon 380 str. F0488]